MLDSTSKNSSSDSHLSERGIEIFKNKLYLETLNHFIQFRVEPILNLSVRVHTRVALASLSTPCGSWARLWYFLRGVDFDGRGLGAVSVQDLLSIFSLKQSTLYQLLREGKRWGAFRDWKICGDRLEIILGGLQAVALNLGLSDWGAVADYPLQICTGLLTFRSWAGVAQSKRCQQGSFNAAKKGVKNRELRKKIVRLDELTMLCSANPHTQTGTGASSQPLPKRVVHVSARKIFVSAGFICYGASQKFIADEAGASKKSIQRYLDFLKIPRKQLVQSRGAFSAILSALDHDCAMEHTPIAAGEAYLGYENGQFLLNECSMEGHRIPATPCHYGRIFKISRHDPDSRWRFAKKIWLNRCNIYSIDLALRTTRAAKREYKRLAKLMKEKNAPDVCIRLN